MSPHQRIQKPIHHLFPQLFNRIAQPSPEDHDSSSRIRGHSEGSKSVKGFARRWKELIKRRGRRRSIVGALPDDVLLNIFDFYRLENYVGPTYPWHRLAHVCKRWRHIVFASVRRLDIRIAFTERTPIRKLLRVDVWPPLSIIIKYRLSSTTSSFPTSSLMTALDHRDRVYQMQLSHLSPALLEILATSIQEPFPALTILELCSDDDTTPIFPESFLAGFAPRLQRLLLEGIAFPALPRLLLSAIGLVSLLLDKIPPNTGYISPEVMATCLSTLTSLKFLRIEFQSPTRAFDGSQRLQTPTRAVLPTLTWLEFKGDNEYMEDLVARIGAPLLNNTQIKFFYQTIFDITQLSQFIERAERLNDLPHAKVDFLSDFAEITLSQQGSVGNITLQISSTMPGQQVSSMAQICHRASPLLSGVERLEICGGEYGYSHGEWRGNIENTHWLGILYPFVAVERLHVTEYLGSLVASAIGGIPAGRAAQVLPELRSLFLEELEPSGFVPSAIRQFVSARRHPIAVCCRKREWEDELRWLDLVIDD